MKAWVLVGVVWLLLTGSAGATVIGRGSDTSQPYAEWIAQAQVPTPDGKVWIHAEECPNWPGYSCARNPRPLRNTASIWLRPNLRDPRYIFFHELGHVFDFLELRRSGREAFRAATGLAGQWRPELMEAFADAYRDCALGVGDPSVCATIR